MNQQVLKRIFDIVLSLTGLIFLSPVIMLISIGIKISSSGPIIFKQTRIGKDGKPFSIYKFRTMVKNASATGPAITRGNDSRITPFGQLLRKYKLDEIPQLLNVLKGEMSFVGPRPEVPEYVRCYSNEQKKVLEAKPGITDLASVYYRNEVQEIGDNEDLDEVYVKRILPKKLFLNLRYLKNQSFFNDLKIILLTLLVTLFPTIFQNTIRGKILSIVHSLKGKKRKNLKIGIDALIICFAYVMSFLIRFEGRIPAVESQALLLTLPTIVPFIMFFLIIFKIYHGTWQYASIKDLYSVIMATLSSSISSCLLIYALQIKGIPYSVVIINWLLDLILLGGVRFTFRFYQEILPHSMSGRKNTLVIGAGDAGEMIIRQMKINSRLGYYPVGLLDDDPRKQGLLIHGVPVLGTIKDINEIVKLINAQEIIIATPSATATQMRKIVQSCEACSLPFKTVPGPKEIINGKVSITQLREVKIDDLLGREPLRIDTSEVRAFIRGKRVLVTGAAGFIGAELCRQIIKYAPALLILLDKSENDIFFLERELRDQTNGHLFQAIVGDITDDSKMEWVMRRFCPEVVFHAAAHKHVPLMEANPEEAIKNNTLGTIKVATIAAQYGVSKFVFISTDKAVAPTSIMGASKRIAELYIQGMSQIYKTKFITVRFGNVLGSTGSVIPIFQEQIKRGGPITVTDPEMTRFFMTISESVQLILQASTMGQGGEIFILDMGEPIRILDMARHLISMSGWEPDKDIKIEFMGLRPGEKLHEELWNGNENPLPTYHDKILVSQTISEDWQKICAEIKSLEECVYKMDRANLVKKVQNLLPEYKGLNIWVEPERSLKKLLLVEDEIDFLEILEDALKSEFYVIKATNGEQALKLLSLEKPDLVLLDVFLPGVMGYKVLQKIRKDALLKDTPVIMTSSFERIPRQVLGLDRGLDEILIKPFTLDELKAKINLVLNGYLIRYQQKSRLIGLSE